MHIIFLQKIEERGNRTTHNLHKMQLDLDKAQVALGNTTNRLMSLQHSQFVENRVYDDDETFASAANIPDISQSTAEKPNLVDALQYALSSGVKMMDKYYEKVTFELSDDSEDDEVDEAGQSSKRYFSIAMCQRSMCILYSRVFIVSSIIFRPKDPYRDRPLPHLIGSKDWQEKWHIGLVDSDAEDVSENTIDEMSESSSSASVASLQSHVPDSKSESESSVWGIGATSTILSTDPSHKKGISIFRSVISLRFSFFLFQFIKTFSMRVREMMKRLLIGNLRGRFPILLAEIGGPSYVMKFRTD